MNYKEKTAELIHARTEARHAQTDAHAEIIMEMMVIQLQLQRLQLRSLPGHEKFQSLFDKFANREPEQWHPISTPRAIRHILRLCEAALDIDNYFKVHRRMQALSRFYKQPLSFI